MTEDVHPLFRPCEGYLPMRDIVGPVSVHDHAPDCSTCARQYRDQVCQIFRKRFLRALAAEAKGEK